MTKVRMAKALTVHDVLVLVCKGRRATRIEIALVKRPIRRQGVCQRQIELLSRLHTSHTKWSSTDRWHGRLIYDRCPSCFDADALHTKPPQRSREQASNKPSCSEKGVQERPRRKDVGGAVPRHAATDGPQPTDSSRVTSSYTAGFVSKGLGFVGSSVGPACSTRRCVSTHAVVLVQEREDGHTCTFTLLAHGRIRLRLQHQTRVTKTTVWCWICTHLERIDVHIDVKGHLELKELALAVEARYCTRHIPRTISTLLCLSTGEFDQDSGGMVVTLMQSRPGRKACHQAPPDIRRNDQQEIARRFSRVKPSI